MTPELQPQGAALLGEIGTLEPLDVTLAEALGCLLAEDVVAAVDWPHFAVCTASGFAARHDDARPGSTLEIVDDVPAGYQSSASIGLRKTIRVHSGAPLPNGADTVLPESAVTVADDRVTVTTTVPSGRAILAKGSIATKDKELVGEGTRVEARTLGVLAALGRSRVSVRPRPRVVIIAIGSELIASGTPATAGLLHESTGALLASAVAAADAIPYRVGPLSDESSVISDTLDDQQVRADLMVVIGGIETESDSLRTVIDPIGEVRFEDHSASVGSFGVGVVGEDSIPLICLPDDTTAAYLLFQMLAAPVIAGMMGHAPASRFDRRLRGNIPADRSTQLLLATTSAAGDVTPVATSSPTVLDLASADCIVFVPAGQGARNGSQVRVHPLSDPGA